MAVTSCRSVGDRKFGQDDPIRFLKNNMCNLSCRGHSKDFYADDKFWSYKKRLIIRFYGRNIAWPNSGFLDSESKPVIGLVPVMGYIIPPTSSINLYVKSIFPLPLTVTLLVPPVVLCSDQFPTGGFYRKFINHWRFDKYL